MAIPGETLASPLRRQIGMRNLASTLAILVLFVVAVWGIGRVLGFRISLWGTLIASIALTVILNLVLAVVRRR